MPIARFQMPDGRIARFEVPEGTTPEQAQAMMAEHFNGGASEVPLTKNQDLASQAGLTARSVLKGALAIPAMGADALGGIANAGLDLVDSGRKAPRFQQTLPTIDNLLDGLGLNKPDTPMQRVVGKTVETMTGAGAGAKLAELAGRGATGATQAVLQRLAENQGSQAVAGATAGAAGQQSAESGGGWGSQAASALLGGLAGSGIASGTKAAAGKIQTLITPRTPPADIERRITVALQSQGIDPDSITQAMRAALTADVREALKTEGTLNAAALARLADYRRLGMTPTRGRVTLDPYDVTQEQNAMRMAAATGARDAQLPAIAQNNNRTLLDSMERLRPVADQVALGENVISPIMARDAAMSGRINSLYQAARDTGGRSLPLEGGTFTRTANEALDQANVGSFLPPDIARKMNAIAKGKIPLTVDVAEQLKTSIGSLQRNSNDGNVRTALGIVRRALDNAPLQNDRIFNPGNVPAVPGTVPPSVAAVGQESVDAFNAARSAARQRFAWQEGTPAVARALDGAAPDTFIQREIISKSAATADVQRLAREVSQSPQAVQSIRSGIVQHLKDAAIGKGNTTDTANFSGRQWLSALSQIGDQKLRLFFDPAELEQLRAIGRVGTIETFQPRGSAVNNSNTAAGIGSLLQGVTKNIGPLLGKIPGGQALARPALDNITLSFMERGANNVPRGLLQPVPQANNGGLLDAALIPMFSGGLLAPHP